MEISVIVPIYNVEEYLNKCLDSILHQTFTNYELILIDDGSTDSSSQIADEYAVKDDRIRVIHKKNGGLSDARNYGLDKATGKYICFIDSDDWIEETYLEELLHLAKEQEADIVICDYLKNSGDISVTQPAEPDIVIQSGTDAIDNIYGSRYGEYVVAWNKLYRKEIFDNLRYPVGMIHEDEAIFGEIFCRASKVVRTERILYNYRTNNSSSIMSSEFSIKRLDIIKALEMRMGTFTRQGLKGYYEKDSFKYLYKILLNIVELKKLEGQHSDIIKELKKKYWTKYRESLGFNWSIKRKVGMFFFGIYPKAYLLRYKKNQ